jgi:ABC-type dipeptide/oligopeptide/nickel transport system permease component
MARTVPGKQLIWLLLMAWSCATLVFVVSQFIPGDPAVMLLGERGRSPDVQRLRSRLQLNRPLAERYGSYLLETVRFRFGHSLATGEAVIARIGPHLASSVALTMAALGVTLLAAFPLGLAVSLRPGRPLGWLAQTVTSLGLSVPPFLLALVLILLVSVRLRWLPVSAPESPARLVLPALSLGLYFAFPLARIIGNLLNQEMQTPYALLARAKGLSRRRVLLAHALPNIWLPVAANLGLQLGALLSGAVVTETVFSRPGIGVLLMNAIRQRDYPVIQGVSLFIALVYLLIRFFLDGIIGPWLHPGLRRTHGT